MGRAADDGGDDAPALASLLVHRRGRRRGGVDAVAADEGAMKEAFAGFILAVAALHALGGSPAQAVTNAYNDAERLPADIASNAGYLWIGDLPEKEWAQFKQQLRYKLNTVSTEADIVQIYDVAPDLIRFDRRDPGPAFAKAWEKTADVDTIFHLQVEVEEAVEYGHYGRDGKWVTTRTEKGKKARKSVMAAQVIEDCPACRGWLPSTETAGLLLLDHSNSPILSGLWFWARLSRELPLNNREDGTGYYDFLGWTDRDAMFRTIRFHEDDSIAAGQLYRAVVEAGSSGVAQNGRHIWREQATTGPAWRTIDVDQTDGDKNVVHRLKRGELKGVAEEWYVFLPCGIPGTALFEFETGKRQNTAPDFIGGYGDPDYGGEDLRIHVGTLTCAACHSVRVLKVIGADGRDWTRFNFDGPQHMLQSPDYNLEKDFNREFFRSIEKERAKSEAAFVEAMQDISGLQIGKLVDAENRMWRLYANTPMDAEAVGRLMGCDEKTLVGALKAVNDRGGVDPILFPLLRQGKINRRSIEEESPVIHAILRDYTP